MNRVINNLLCSGIVLFVLMQSANASFLTDPDGFSLNLTTTGSSTNQFGPPSFTDNYDPAGSFGNVIPAAMVDGTEMEVSFFSDYFEVRQFATSTFQPIALDWLMLFDNIDSPGQIVGVSVENSTNTFVDALTANFTDNSVSLAFAGGSSGSLQIGGIGWFARVDVVFGQVEVPAPAVSIFVFLGLILVAARAYLAGKQRV